MIKINMYGGALTISYNLAKCLRGRGKDVTLFVDRVFADKSYSPAWEDKELDGNYPEWIKFTDARFDRALFGDRPSRDFASMLSDCDILHLHGEAYLWANIFKKRFVYHSYGYDLDQLPFRKSSVKSAIVSCLSRRGIKKAGKILIAPHQKIFLERLGVAERGIYMPFPVDAGKYRSGGADTLKNKILADRGADLIFFHPARHEWVDNKETSSKGNDKALRAFSSYEKRSRRKAVLILVNKGRDVAGSKKLIDDLRINKSVMWLEPMPKEMLIEYYNASDLVLDQFNLGSFGQLFLEAMACGRPTFAYLKGYEDAYAEQPPAVNVFTDDEIAEKLIELSEDRARREEIGLRSREWVERYHGWRPAGDKFIELYKTFMDEQDRC